MNQYARQSDDTILSMMSAFCISDCLNNSAVTETYFQRALQKIREKMTTFARRVYVPESAFGTRSGAEGINPPTHCDACGARTLG